MKAVVVALGKMGLPLAVHIARAGHDVVGCDIDPAAVNAVNAVHAVHPLHAGRLLGVGDGCVWGKISRLRHLPSARARAALVCSGSR